MPVNSSHMIKVDEFELDDRMSEETREFITSYMKVAKPETFMTKPVTEIRAEIEMAHEHDAPVKLDNLPERPAEISIRNPVDGYEIPAFVFAPTDAPRNAPLVVYFHGGGWSFNRTKLYEHMLATLASRSRSIWISADYRLAPEHKYRIQVLFYFTF